MYDGNPGEIDFGSSQRGFELSGVDCIEQEKDREKERVGGRPAKLNEKKGDRDLEREIKNKGDTF